MPHLACGKLRWNQGCWIICGTVILQATDLSHSRPSLCNSFPAEMNSCMPRLTQVQPGPFRLAQRRTPSVQRIAGERASEEIYTMQLLVERSGMLGSLDLHGLGDIHA